MQNTITDDSKKSSQKTRRSNRTFTDRIPKLSVTNVENGTVLNCHMENKPKTITFKFDLRDVNPVDIASKLVSHAYFHFIVIIANRQCEKYNEIGYNLKHKIKLLSSKKNKMLRFYFSLLYLNS